MSLNSKLSKEACFAYKIFATAAQRSSGYDTRADGSDENVIIAGGAIRDLYFDRRTRDLDLYYNVDVISASGFATALKNLDVQAMARAAGFSTARVVRLSDNSEMGLGGKDDSEDWGDVSDHAKSVLSSFMGYYLANVRIGLDMTTAIMQAYRLVPGAQHIAQASPRNSAYFHHIITAATSAKQTSSSGSGSGSKIGRAHPLKSVEEFRIYLDGNFVSDVEVMGVAGKPIDYVMSHFAVKLSRAYYDGRACHFTSDFMSDARNKTITVACPVEHARFERLFSYYLPKMKTYFPDFDVRVDLDSMNGRNW